jgi:hypothetical protein
MTFLNLKGGGLINARYIKVVKHAGHGAIAFDKEGEQYALLDDLEELRERLATIVQAHPGFRLATHIEGENGGPSSCSFDDIIAWKIIKYGIEAITCTGAEDQSNPHAFIGPNGMVYCINSATEYESVEAWQQAMDQQIETEAKRVKK